MKLTIVPVDGLVMKDGVGYSGLVWQGTPNNIHALQWFDFSGWLEFVMGEKPNEEITVLPDWVNNALEAWTVANTPVPPQPPTAEQNKVTASKLLQNTDWTSISDVGNPQLSNPYLSNQAEFIAYRNAVRQYAVSPVSGYVNWPTIPQEKWVRT